MSQKPETLFTHRVHKHLSKGIYALKNNNPYTSGVADVWYSGNAGDLWIEYKFIVVPKRDTTVVNMVQGKDPLISRLQQQWLEARSMEGRSVGVMLGCKDGGVWFPNLDWQHGFTTREFKSWVTPHHKLAALIEQRVNYPRESVKI